MILVCYDGSDDARAAIEDTGRLLSGQPVVILTVWERFVDVMTRSGSFGWIPVGDIDDIDKASERSALERAQQGVELARSAGLEAEPRVTARVGTIAHTILEEARRLDAQAIVMGTRGLAGLRSLLLGSESHAVLQHADRTVVVVPSAEIAERRRS